MKEILLERALEELEYLEEQNKILRNKCDIYEALFRDLKKLISEEKEDEESGI